MNKIKWFNGIRAFGLFLVLGYHLFFHYFPGGFLGVDIFFTFSGFLITSIILEEVRKHGDFKFGKFIKRRTQRILIPLALSILITLPFALLISPDFTVGISKQIASALSFTTNWYNIFAGTSYEAQLLPPLYIHMWSLAVEMQFYLLWGLLCTGLFKMIIWICKHRNKNHRHTLYSDDDADSMHQINTVANAEVYRRFKYILCILSAVIAITSFVYMELLFASGHDLNLIYFNSLSRLFPFYIGALAASVWSTNPEQEASILQRIVNKRPRQTRLIACMAIFTSIFIILFWFTQFAFEDAFMYHVGFLATSLLTVVMIYGTHLLHLCTPAIKEPRILTATADISYDVYLVHWPIYIVFSSLIINATAGSLVSLMITLILSVFMVYFAERRLIPNNTQVNVQTDAKQNQSFGKWIFGFMKPANIFMGLFSGICLILCIIVLANAPKITSIEADFAAGHIVQDIRILTNDTERLPSDNAVQIKAPLIMHVLPEVTVVSGPDSEFIDVTTPGNPQKIPQQMPAEPTPIKINFPPSPHPHGVTLIGDSVPLGAQAVLINTIEDMYIDAEVARFVPAGLPIIESLVSAGTLREFVVLALGTNGDDRFKPHFSDIIDAIPQGHRIIIVTPFDGRQNNNAQILDETSEWMRTLDFDFVTIADWNMLARNHIDLLAGDRVHMGNRDSMLLYTQMIQDALQIASERPMK